MPRQRPMRPALLTGQEWQRLRKHAGFTVEVLARELGCSARTIYNIENANQQKIGEQLARLFLAVIYPPTRALLPMAGEHAKKILQEADIFLD